MPCLASRASSDYADLQQHVRLEHVSKAFHDTSSAQRQPECVSSDLHFTGLSMSTCSSAGNIVPTPVSPHASQKSHQIGKVVRSRSNAGYAYRVAAALECLGVRQVECGLNLTVALTVDGRVWQMGETGAALDKLALWEHALVPVQVSCCYPQAKYTLQAVQGNLSELLGCKSASMQSFMSGL